MHEILYRLHRKLADGVSGLSAEQMQVCRGPGKWSIQQIVEHLLLTYRSTVGTVETRVLKGTPTKARPSLVQRAGQMAVMTFGYFPTGRKAPGAVCPVEAGVQKLSYREINERIAEDLGALDMMLMRAEALFGTDRRSISHMVLGPLSVQQWRRFHLRHGEHHVRQILATRKGMGA